MIEEVESNLNLYNSTGEIKYLFNIFYYYAQKKDKENIKKLLKTIINNIDKIKNNEKNKNYLKNEYKNLLKFIPLDEFEELYLDFLKFLNNIFPYNKEILIEITEIISLSGNVNEAYKYIIILLKNFPEDIRIYELAIDIYKSLNFEGELYELIKKGLEIDPGNEKLLETKDELSEKFINQSLMITPEIVKTFYNIFKGNENYIARQFVSQNRAGYTPIKCYSTKELLKYYKDHLEGKDTYGIYTVVGPFSKILAFDIDIKKSFLKTISTQNDFNYLLEIAKKITTSLIKVIEKYELEYLIEFSGYKGYHIWIPFQEFISAANLKKAGEIIKSKIIIPDEIDIEIFPKQIFVNQDRLGNLIKLPLGIHKKTGNRSFFINKYFIKYENQFEILRLFNCNPEYKLNFMYSFKDTFIDETGYEKNYKENNIKEKNNKKFIYNLNLNNDKQNNNFNNRKYSVKQPTTEEQTSSLTILDRDIDTKNNIDSDEINFEFILNKTQLEEFNNLKNLFLKCKILKNIYFKLKEKTILTKNEKLILFNILYVISFDLLKIFYSYIENYENNLNNNEKNNNKLNLIEYSAYPLSCSKIRDLLPEISDDCNCEFHLNENEFPSPLIFYDKNILDLTLAIPREIETLIEKEQELKLKIEKLTEERNYIMKKIKNMIDQIGSGFETKFYKIEIKYENNIPKLIITKKAITNEYILNFNINDNDKSNLNKNIENNLFNNKNTKENKTD